MGIYETHPYLKVSPFEYQRDVARILKGKQMGMGRMPIPTVL